jgi:hypothetical protein
MRLQRFQLFHRIYAWIGWVAQVARYLEASKHLKKMNVAFLYRFGSKKEYLYTKKKSKHFTYQLYFHPLSFTYSFFSLSSFHFIKYTKNI